MGVQTALGQGPRLRGVPGHALLVGRRDAVVQLRDPPRRRHPAPPGPGRHRGVRPRAGRRRPRPAAAAGLDDDAVDPAVEPGPGGRPRRHLLDAPRRRRRRLCAGHRSRRALHRPTRGHRARRHTHRSRPRGPYLHAAVPVLLRPHRCLPGTRRRLRRCRRGHRRRPHGPGLRRGRPGHLRGQRHPDRPGGPRRRPWLLHRRGRRLGWHQRVRGQRRHHPIPQGGRPGRPPRHLRAQLPALLAHRHAHHLQGHLVLVREGHRHPGPDARHQRRHQLGTGPRPRRPLRHVAGRRPRLVDQPQPLLGFADPGVAQRRPRIPPDRRLRRPRRDRGRLRRATRRSAPPVHRRPDPSQPRRPDWEVDDAAGARGTRLLVRVGVDAVRPVPLPVRERAVVRGPLPRRLHRRVHQPDARLVLHDARPGHGAVRPAGLPERDLPRNPAGRGRRQALQEDAQLHRAH